MAADSETASISALHRSFQISALPRRSVVNTFGFAKRFPLGFVSAVILATVVIMAVLAPAVAPEDPNEVVLSERKLDPTGSHLLGTDYHGRDIFSRLIYGGRVSLGNCSASGTARHHSRGGLGSGKRLYWRPLRHN